MTYYNCTTSLNMKVREFGAATQVTHLILNQIFCHKTKIYNYVSCASYLSDLLVSFSVI